MILDGRGTLSSSVREQSLLFAQTLRRSRRGGSAVPGSGVLHPPLKA